MKKPRIPANEEARLADLQTYEILDTLEEDDYDFLTKMASQICETKISLVSLIDDNRQWFKSHHGMDVRETPRDISFCAHAINDPKEVLIVNDARLDERFVENPVVKGKSNLVFYAGVPLISKKGHALGTLCAIDDKPKQLSEEQIGLLQSLAKQVTNLLELRKSNIHLKSRNKSLKSFFDLNTDPCIIIHENGDYFGENKAWEKLFLNDKKKSNPQNIFDIIHPKELNTFKKNIQELEFSDKHKKIINLFENTKNKYTKLKWQGFKIDHLIYIIAQNITSSEETKEQYRELLSRNEAIMSSLNNSTLVSITDKNGIIKYANEMFTKVSGYAHEVLMGKTHQIINSKFHPKSFWDNMWQTILSGSVWRDEVCNVAKNGDIYWVDTVIHPVLDDKNEITEFIAIRYLITERKKIEQNLIKTKELLLETGKIARIGSWEYYVAENEIILSDMVNEIMEFPLGYKYKFTGKPQFEVQNKGQKSIIELISEAGETGVEYDEERKLFSPKGNELWIRVMIKTEIVNGKVIRVFGTMQDIRGRKAAEKEKEYHTILMDGLFNLSPLGIVLNDLETGAYIELNNKLIEPTGYTKEEFVKLSYWDITPKEYAPLEEIALQQMNELGYYKTFQKEYIKKDGTRYPVELRGVVIQDTNGNKKIWSFVEDITERVATEKKLKVSEETFRGSFDYAGIGMALVNEKGNWLKVNKKLIEMLGYEKEELLKLNFQTITHPEDIDADLELMAQLISGEIDHYQMEKRYFHKSGHFIYTILSVSMVKDMKGKIQHFISQVVDITAAKKAEIKLKELFSKNQAILDASTEVTIIGTDNEGIIQTFNKGAENMLGYTMKELVNKHSASIIHKKEEIISRGEELSATYQKKISGFDIFIYEANKFGSDVREWTYLNKNGNELTVLLNITPIHTDGRIIGYLGIGTDITAIKKAEKELKNILSLTENQNERLQNFAYIVSHNLRSHSGNLTSLLELFLDENPKFQELEIIQMLALSANNLKDTISHLSEVALLQDSSQEEFYPIQLQASINNAINNVSALAIEKQIEIQNNVGSSITILGLNAYVDSVLLNFLTNGIKYRAENRKSFIKLSSKIEKKYVVLTIEDNGLGIDLKRHGKKLFGMYKTFHKHEEARGLGLFITKNQIEAMGGYVEVESTVDQGTTFKIYFINEKN
ncbi:hypothetical protein DNU06_04085 [Putridiphycobacter roseus]|uniref:histidine kinase n=1 Tax=Putridiphycobacter roseus TaxID=2219161 RepID=A0A2W1NIN3_9FLAO|nr:PAS domain S-box protein [Putridiphycobacter roseus]PZE17806.1 hypothetical protein DNU06_04085 [Putridiphycobacter roseus]